MSLLCFMVVFVRVYKQLVGYSFRSLTQNHTWKSTKIRSSIWKQNKTKKSSFFTSGIQQCLLVCLLSQASQAMQTALFLALSKNSHNIRETFIVESCLQGRCTSCGPMSLILQSHKPTSSSSPWHKQHFPPGQWVFQSLSFPPYSSTLAFGLKQLDLSCFQGPLNFIILKFTGITVI